MTIHVYSSNTLALALTLVGGLSGPVARGAQVPAPNPPDVQPGVEVLTRGPVHEAFAETVSVEPEAGLIVATAPPAAVEEVPPDQRPDGANVAWIPGYWAWDQERGTYLWVSGIWRDVPPGRQWIPGYWTPRAQGYQWVSGYWADVAAREAVYLPEPPATIDVGPNIPAPSAEFVWAPGCWVWHQGHYAWRPGYWVQMHPDWIWVPAHYVVAPQGYIFSDGYWDFAIERRGVLFAPVYFQPAVFHAGFVFSPAIAINLSIFTDHLFVAPACHHYYFGDYYAPRYHDMGFYAAFSFNAGPVAVEPIMAYTRWEHRSDPGWESHERSAFIERRDHENLRPPHTFAAQQKAIAAAPAALPAPGAAPGATAAQVLAAPLAQLPKTPKASAAALRDVPRAEKQEHVARGSELQRVRGERQHLESGAAASTASPAPPGKTPPASTTPASTAPPSSSPPPSAAPQKPGAAPAPGPGKPQTPPSSSKAPSTQPPPTGAPPSGAAPPSATAPTKAPETKPLPRSPIGTSPALQPGAARTPPGRPQPPAPDTTHEAQPRSQETPHRVPPPVQAAPPSAPAHQPSRPADAPARKPSKEDKPGKPSKDD